MARFEAGTHDEVGAGGEGGRVADVVEVAVRPDDRFDVAAPHARAGAVVVVGGSVEQLGHVLRRPRDRRGLSDRGDCRGAVALPVAPHAQVEDDVARAVRDEEAVDGGVGDAGEVLHWGGPEEGGVEVQGCWAVGGRGWRGLAEIGGLGWRWGRWVRGEGEGGDGGSEGGETCLSITRTVTVEVEWGTLSEGAGLGVARYSAIWMDGLVGYPSFFFPASHVR